MAEASTPRRVCVLGATSSMAEHTARLLAAKGCALALVGRNMDRMAAIAGDLRVRGAPVVVQRAADLAAPADPDAVLAWASEALGGLDAVLLFQGELGDQALAERDPAEAARILGVNFSGAAALSLAAAVRLETSPHPRPALIAIGSVAGDRGRASNFVYGAAKGGLAILYQGLAHRLALAGAKTRVVIVKAGFVDTPMTDGFKKGGPLWAKPETLAAIVVASLEKGGPIVYAPWFWRFILLIIRAAPTAVMNRVNL